MATIPATTKPKTGWGIGYADDNIGGGFNAYTDPNALNTEMQRMDTVMKNRTTQGLGNNAQQNYYNQLKGYAPVNPDQYKTQSATINDIASKYGFDFSREYANRQAEAEAQAKRNANADAQRRNTSNRDVNLKAIDNNLMSQAEGLDRNYFQQYQQQQQAQVNGGINGGIAADQDLRMAMSRQAAMGDAYRDANLGRMQENQRFTNDDLRLAEELGLINQQGLARAEGLYNDRLMQGAGLAQNLDQFNLSQNSMLLNAAQQNRAQNLGAAQWDQQYKRGVLESDRNYQSDEFWKRANQNNWLAQFNEDKRRDTRDYSRGVLESDRNFGFENEKFDWSKSMDSANLSLARQAAAQRQAEAVADAAVKAAKPKTGPQNKLDSTSYWADQKSMLDYYGPEYMERAILNDPQKIKELAAQGYDITTFIDSMWNVATNGRFKTKKDYTKYLDTTKKNLPLSEAEKKKLEQAKIEEAKMKARVKEKAI